MNKAERLHLSRVADLGCIVCRLEFGIEDSPAECHHIRTGQGHKRASYLETIPLCPLHHRTGGHSVAYHAGARAWEAKYGTELELLEAVRELLG